MFNSLQQSHSSEASRLSAAHYFLVRNVTRRFITVFTRAHCLFLSWARWIQSMSSHTYVVKKLITVIKCKALDLNSKHNFGNTDSNIFNTEENTDALSSAIYSSVNNSFLKHFILNSVSFILFYFLRFCLLCSYFIFIHTHQVSASHFFCVPNLSLVSLFCSWFITYSLIFTILSFSVPSHTLVMQQFTNGLIA